MSKTTITVIATLAILLFFVAYVTQCSKVNSKEQIVKQLTAEFNDTLKVVRKDNNDLYVKVAALTDMNASLDKIVAKLKNTIFAKTKEIIRLEGLVGEGIGTIDSVIYIDSNYVGLILSFKDTTNFYTTYIRVRINEDENPDFYYEINIKPFSLTTYLVRDKQGIWKGYAVPQKEFKDFIKIDSMKVEIEKDEFVEYYNTISAFKVGLGFSIGSNFVANKVLYNVGLSILLQEKHSINLSVSLNSDWYFLRYNYYFF